MQLFIMIVKVYTFKNVKLVFIWLWKIVIRSKWFRDTIFNMYIKLFIITVEMNIEKFVVSVEYLKLKKYLVYIVITYN